ncbi:helicase associated domain-containing protein [Streptomyces sp. NBC_00289]
MQHYAALRELLADDAETGQTEVLPDVTVYSVDIGKWLAKQRKPAA